MSYYVTKITPWIETKKKRKSCGNNSIYMEICHEIGEKNRDCFL